MSLIGRAQSEDLVRAAERGAMRTRAEQKDKAMQGNQHTQLVRKHSASFLFCFIHLASVSI